MNTNWSSPKTNIISGMLDLRKALACGYNARLVRARNENCTYPIKVNKVDEDFRNYEFSSGYMSTREEIVNSKNLTDVQKALTLSFKTCYGTPEAVKRYYETGELSEDNFRGTGTSHLVHVKDKIDFLTATGDTERAEMFSKQYITGETANERHLWDFYRYKHDSPWAVKYYRHKLWVVELLKDDQPKLQVPVLISILNVVLFPLKYVPRKLVLKMDNYTNYTFRLGDVINGFSIEFHVPRKFGFN